METNVSITLYKPMYRDDFIRFNREWIEHFFRLEPSDLKIFSDPERHIIDKGGQIFIALQDGKPVGCCALVHHPDTGQYELAKMAVTPSAQGHHAGTLLGLKLLEYARSIGVKRLFLEGNTLLEASIKLYRHLGFKPVEDYAPVYDRCDIYMTMDL